MFQHFNLLASKRGFKTVGKADQELILVSRWRARDDSDCSARMDQGVVGPADLNQRNDLCAGENVVWLMGHDDWENNRRFGSKASAVSLSPRLSPKRRKTDEDYGSRIDCEWKFGFRTLTFGGNHHRSARNSSKPTPAWRRTLSMQAEWRAAPRPAQSDTGSPP